MADICKFCARSPRGIDGHAGLFVSFEREPDAPSPPRMPVFVCSICATTWRRSYDGSGEFTWISREPMAKGPLA
jgi:hypothetical protein